MGSVSRWLSCLPGYGEILHGDFLVPIDEFMSAPIMWVVFLYAKMVDSWDDGSDWKASSSRSL
jgi:hypothetical protein